MKTKLNVVLATLAVVLLGCGVCEQAQAVAMPINGSVQFFGSATPSGASPGSPVTVNFTNPWSTLNGLGIYAGIPAGVSTTFTSFAFTGDGAGVGGAVLSAPPIAPLWSFSFGGVNYSFDLEALTNGHTDAGSISFTGNGIAHATGFDDTPASWALQGSGSDFTFRISTSTTAAVPEGGATVALLGISLIALLILRRQLIPA